MGTPWCSAGAGIKDRQHLHLSLILPGVGEGEEGGRSPSRGDGRQRGREESGSQAKG